MIALVSGSPLFLITRFGFSGLAPAWSRLRATPTCQGLAEESSYED